MYISVHDGVTYHVEVNGQGEPVVLLHGFTGSTESWRELTTELNGLYKVISIDLLGHGLSDKPSDSGRYSIEQTKADLVFIFNQLKLESVRLVGYSMGGRIALSFAIAYPHLLSQLILESTSPGLASEEERVQRTIADNKLASLIERNGIAWFSDYWSNIALFQSQKLLSITTQQQISATRLNNSSLGLSNSLKGIGTGRQPSYWHQLEQLSMPIMLVVGALDTKYVQIAEMMKVQMTSAQLIVIEEAGHNVHLEKPTAFLSVVKEALEQNRNIQ